MKQSITLILVVFLCTSCIPVSIAPKIKDHKIKLAKRFKRKLPKDYAFIFKDPKDADEFYYFINAKYNLNHNSVEQNVPISIDSTEYFLSFHEAEKTTKTINLLPMLIDARLQNSDMDPMLEDAYFSRKGDWYLALVVTDTDFQDCLNPNYPSRVKIVKYLQALKEEYLTTHNYLESMLKNDQLLRN